MEKEVQAMTGHTVRSASEGLGSKVKLIKQAWNPVVWEGCVRCGGSPQGQRHEWVPVVSWLGWMGLQMGTGIAVDTVVPQVPGPSLVQKHLSQLQWLSSQSAGAPLFQGLRAAVCQDKLEAVGIARVGWPLAGD